VYFRQLIFADLFFVRCRVAFVTKRYAIFYAILLILALASEM
jgi:hypothetical protein